MQRRACRKPSDSAPERDEPRRPPLGGNCALYSGTMRHCGYNPLAVGHGGGGREMARQSKSNGSIEKKSRPSTAPSADGRFSAPAKHLEPRVVSHHRGPGRTRTHVSNRAIAWVAATRLDRGRGQLLMKTLHENRRKIGVMSAQTRQTRPRVAAPAWSRRRDLSRDRSRRFRPRPTRPGRLGRPRKLAPLGALLATPLRVDRRHENDRSQPVA